MYLPKDNIAALEGTPEHGHVRVSRALFLAILSMEWPTKKLTVTDWGKPEEDGSYTPTMSRVVAENGLDQKLKDTFDDESPAAR